MSNRARVRRSRHVELRHWLGGVLHHQQLIQIDGVLGVRYESGQHVPAFLRRNPLQCTRQREASESRLILSCELPRPVERIRKGLRSFFGVVIAGAARI